MIFCRKCCSGWMHNAVQLLPCYASVTRAEALSDAKILSTCRGWGHIVLLRAQLVELLISCSLQSIVALLVSSSQSLLIWTMSGNRLSTTVEKATADQRVVGVRRTTVESTMWSRCTDDVTGHQRRRRQISRSVAQRREYLEISSTDGVRRDQTEYCFWGIVRSGNKRLN